MHEHTECSNGKWKLRRRGPEFTVHTAALVKPNTSEMNTDVTF